MKWRYLFQTLYSLLLVVVKGIVLKQLWLWFIVPFFGLPPLSCPVAIGIAIMFLLLIHLPIWKFDNHDEEFRYNITIGLKPILLLGLGYIVHLFM
jgi:hypothetical protein